MITEIISHHYEFEILRDHDEHRVKFIIMVVELIFYKVDHDDDGRIYPKEFEDNLFVEEIEKLDDYQNMENVGQILSNPRISSSSNTSIFMWRIVCMSTSTPLERDGFPDRILKILKSGKFPFWQLRRFLSKFHGDSNIMCMMWTKSTD